MLTLIRRVTLGLLLCVWLWGCANGPRVAGRSPTEAFPDRKVVDLIAAASRHNADEARRLVDSGANVNTIGKDSATPLVWMLASRDLAGMKLLLDLGADPNLFEPDGVGPPLRLAAGGGHRDALELLLSYGADPNLIYGTSTPVMMAISGSHLDCAEILLAHGADINLAPFGPSALSAAMLHVQFGDAVWVLEHGYKHDLPMAKRMLSIETPRAGQEAEKVKALAIVEAMLSERGKPKE